MLILRKFLRDVPAVIGALLVLAVVALAIFGPWIAPYPEDASASHLLRRL
jgi:peptide/nickel transport system permease protein